MKITYDRDEKEIIVEDYQKGIMLICTDVVLCDTPAILVEGDYYTPDDWVGGMTADEKAEAMYYRHPERFEVVEP